MSTSKTENEKGVWLDFDKVKTDADVATVLWNLKKWLIEVVPENWTGC